MSVCTEIVKLALLQFVDNHFRDTLWLYGNGRVNVAKQEFTGGKLRNKQ